MAVPPPSTTNRAIAKATLAKVRWRRIPRMAPSGVGAVATPLAASSCSYSGYAPSPTSPAAWRPPATALLREPESFEGLPCLLIEADPGQATAANLEHEGAPRNCLDSIPPSERIGVRDDHRIAGLDEPLWL